MTIVIDAGDERWVPTRASCDGCGATWQRPTDDTRAETLIAFAHQHHHQQDEPLLRSSGPQTPDEQAFADEWKWLQEHRYDPTLPWIAEYLDEAEAEFDQAECDIVVLDALDAELDEGIKQEPLW